MENNIKVEQWLDNEIRFVEVNGEWQAVAKDITDALGFRMASDALSKMKDKYKGKAKVPTPGGVQTLTTLSNSGLYSLLLNSRKIKSKEMLAHLEEIDYTLVMQVKTPKQLHFEMLLKEQLQRFIDIGGIRYNDWNFYVDNQVIFKDAIDFETEYKIPNTNHRVDFYFKGFDIIIEYDEKHHLQQIKEDIRREAVITNAMIDHQGREPVFIRVAEGEEYQGIIDLFGIFYKQIA